MATNQSWGGRFKSETDKLVADFTDSQHFDRILYAQDIQASIAHANMLGSQKILTPAEAKKIVKGLKQVQAEIESGKFAWRPELEDVHMNIEARLIEIVGETGKKLHTGRSRNDQVALTFRLYVAKKCVEWQKGCIKLCGILLRQAQNNQSVILPGFTHLQPAQPVALAQHLLAYAWMLTRDVARIADALKRIRQSPLGAAALAGSTYPLDPEQVAEEVGFDKIFNNSMDAVSDRDFVMEALFCASVIMMHLSRLCEELILWSTPAFRFIALPDAYSTGSSIMPQKKNPDVAELVRGKCGRVYGNLTAILTIMKGLPLAYNRDMQEDKECFMDSDITVRKSLAVISGLISELSFNSEDMRKACKAGYLNATELADYLVGKGIPFRDAHHVTGSIVAYAERQNKPLEELDISEFQKIESKIDTDVYDILNYEACINRRDTQGGTGPTSVQAQIADLEDWLRLYDVREA